MMKNRTDGLLIGSRVGKRVLNKLFPVLHCGQLPNRGQETRTHLIVTFTVVTVIHGDIITFTVTLHSIRATLASLFSLPRADTSAIRLAI